MEVDIDKRRMCTLSQYRNNPHAYTKKLRHPAAQSETDKFTDRLCAENLRLFDNVGCGENNMKIFKLMKSEVIHE